MNFQPSKILTTPNDKMTKAIFSFTEKLFRYCVTKRDGNFKIQERRAKKIETRVQMKFESAEPARLDMFDRAVLAACITEQTAGHNPTSADIIYRLITGKAAGDERNLPTEKQREEIMTSVKNLSATLIRVDMTEICKQVKKYNGGKPLIFPFTKILPCHIGTGKIGGSTINDAIYFDDESPVMKIAKAKNNQYVTFSNAVLDTGAKHNSRQIIAVKFYVMIRIREILGKNHMKAQTMKFDDIFTKCQMTDASRDKKMKCRNAIKKMMENLKAAGIVKDFEPVKETGKFSSLNIKSD